MLTSLRSTASFTLLPGSLRGALVRSAIAVLALAIVEGVLLFPSWRERFWPSYAVEVIQCLVDGDGKSATSLMRLNAPNPSQRMRWFIARHAMDQSHPRARLICRDVTPDSLAWAAPVAALCRSGRQLYATNVRNSEPLIEQVGEHPAEYCTTAALSRDARRLVSFSAGTLAVWDVHQRRLLWTHQDEELHCFALPPQAPWVVCGNSAGRMVRRRLDNGEELNSLAVHDGAVSSITTTPDGRVAASIGVDLQLKFTDLGRQVVLWSRPHEMQFTVAISEDGQRVAAIRLDRENHNVIIQVINAADGELVHEMVAHTNSVLGLRFIGGDRLAACGHGGGIGVWDLRRGALVQTIEPQVDVQALLAPPASPNR